MSRGNRVDVYLDGDKRWRWRFTSSGRVMADSGQSYHNRTDCLSGAAVVTTAFMDGVVVRILPRHPTDPLDPSVEVTGYLEDGDDE
jgi:uncharacterized protein YegP (UPF0339 family)